MEIPYVQKINQRPESFTSCHERNTQEACIMPEYAEAELQSPTFDGVRPDLRCVRRFLLKRAKNYLPLNIKPTLMLKVVTDQDLQHQYSVGASFK